MFGTFATERPHGTLGSEKYVLMQPCVSISSSYVRITGWQLTTNDDLECSGLNAMWLAVALKNAGSGKIGGSTDNITLTHVIICKHKMNNNLNIQVLLRHHAHHITVHRHIAIMK